MFARVMVEALLTVLLEALLAATLWRSISFSARRRTFATPGWADAIGVKPAEVPSVTAAGVLVTVVAGAVSVSVEETTTVLVTVVKSVEVVEKVSVI